MQTHKLDTPMPGAPSAYLANGLIGLRIPQIPLPGGTALAAHLHLCRTVSRRAERLAVELATMEHVNPAAVKYLNRLSDWLF